MRAIATGALLKDAEVGVGRGRKYARATLRERDSETSFFVVFADEGTQAFQILSRARQGEALSVQGVLTLGTFEKGGIIKASVDLKATRIHELK